MKMREFKGTYLGFSPTDESGTGFGEIEVIIDDRGVKIRMATGLKIDEHEVLIGEFEPMSSEEVMDFYNEASEYPQRTKGFKGSSGYPIFLFLDNPNDGESGLMVNTGGLGEILGPTILFSPAQIERGVFNKALDLIEQNYGVGVLPRLRNNGKAENRT